MNVNCFTGTFMQSGIHTNNRTNTFLKKNRSKCGDVKQNMGWNYKKKYSAFVIRKKINNKWITQKAM